LESLDKNLADKIQSKMYNVQRGKSALPHAN